MCFFFRRRPTTTRGEKPLYELNKDELLIKLRSNLTEPVLNEILERAQQKDSMFINADYLRELLSAYKRYGISRDVKGIISNIFIASEPFISCQSYKHAEVYELQTILCSLKIAAAAAALPPADLSAIRARP